MREAIEIKNLIKCEKGAIYLPEKKRWFIPSKKDDQNRKLPIICEKFEQLKIPYDFIDEKISQDITHKKQKNYH